MNAPAIMSSVTLSVRSEFVRLRQLWKVPLTIIVLGALATLLAFSGSGGGPGSRGEESSTTDAEPSVDLSALAGADGIVAGLDLTTSFVGLLMLVLWGMSVARDYQTGVVRVLFVTQSRRAVVVAGKMIALMAVSLATVALTVGVSVGVAFLAARGQDISTAAWSWSGVTSALVNVGVGALGWGVIGAVLAIATRSAAATVAGGMGYLVLGEPLLGSVWDDSNIWLPGGVLSTVFDGGTAELGYGRAVLLAVGYIAVAVVASHLIVVRRDVTD